MKKSACRHSLPPEAKHQKTTPPIEESEQPPPPPSADEQDPELQDVIRENWGSIRTHASHGPVQSRYNYRHNFGHQYTGNQSNLLRSDYGISNRYKCYHSSCNCCGRYLDEPILITNADTFEIFLERIKEPDILKWAVSQQPNFDWVVELVTNVT